MMTDITNINGMILATATATASVVLLLSLCHCFFGYILFRINLAIDGLLIGIWLGTWALLLKKPEAGGMDIFVASCVGGVLLSVLAWHFYRLLFSLGAAWAVYMAVSGLFGLPASTAGITLGIIAAFITFIYAMVNTKKLVVYFTSICGAISAVIASITLWIGSPVHPYELTGAKLPLFFAGAIAAAVLSIIGIVIQKNTMYLFSPRFTPDGDRSKRRQAGDIKLRVVR